jgi:aminoglycoside phosphotransferase (APT) family kinase protein
MVLLHEDFGDCNIMVDETSCNIVGVVDWAEAEIAPFGLNLYSHQRLISKIHLKNGWIGYDDYAMLEETFWRLTTFSLMFQAYTARANISPHNLHRTGSVL